MICSAHCLFCDLLVWPKLVSSLWARGLLQWMSWDQFWMMQTFTRTFSSQIFQKRIHQMWPYRSQCCRKNWTHAWFGHNCKFIYESQGIVTHAQLRFIFVASVICYTNIDNHTFDFDPAGKVWPDCDMVSKQSNSRNNLIADASSISNLDLRTLRAFKM